MPIGKAPPIGRMRNLAGVFEWRDVPQVGGPSIEPGYVPVGECWCSLVNKGPGDMAWGPTSFLASAATDERNTHVIFTRYREDLTTRHMFELQGKRYRVFAVANDDARRFTRLDVELYGDKDAIGVGPPRLPQALLDEEES